MSTNQIHLGRKSKFRFISILAVVVASVSLAAWLLIQRQTTSYWALKEPVMAGVNVTELELVKVPANFGSLNSNYLSSNQKISGFTTAALPAGTLLTKELLSEEPGQDLVRVVVPIQATLSSAIQTASVVQVWVATKFGNDFAPADLLIEYATVVRNVNADAMLMQKQQVELQIASDYLAGLLDAISANSAIYIVAN